jgi:hypothetical protein
MVMRVTTASMVGLGVIPLVEDQAKTGCTAMVNTTRLLETLEMIKSTVG